MPEFSQYLAEVEVLLWFAAVVVVAVGGTIVWGVRSDAKSEPDGGPTGPSSDKPKPLRKAEFSTAPSCYGTFPYGDPEVFDSRGCLSCIYNTGCANQTIPRKTRDRNHR